MTVQDVVTKVKMEISESQNQRDARVEALWKRLDFQNKGELDWRALQKGLKKIDHPMKNADDMLKAIIKVVDTDGDSKIQYEEFRSFVEAAERQLFFLFTTIDHDQNGKLDKEELRTAFKRVGLSMPQRRLNEFFENIDKNHDGYISFEEWRDFLLFMPNPDPTTTLHAVFTFYSDILTLNAEGDSVVSGETLQGLEQSQPRSPAPSPIIASSSQEESSPQSQSTTSLQTPQVDDYREMETVTDHHQDPQTSMNALKLKAAAPSSDVLQKKGGPQDPSSAAPQAAGSDSGSRGKDGKNPELIKFLPDTGYFIAGAVAGGVSRTATAPLDRLKVYLLVSTKTSANVAAEAVKQGRPVQAAKSAGRPLVTAVMDLYKSGGVRGFFAGNGLNVVKIMPETAIRFGAYEAAKRTFARLEGHNDTRSINPFSKFMAGGVAGMVSQFCVYPLDTLKFRLQSEYVEGGARGNQLLLQTARKMMAEGGFRAAYRGVTMGLIGMFPYSAIDMGTFELLKTSYVSYKAKKYGLHEEDAHPSTFATGIMGATSGAFGASVVYPLNVLRTRLQTQGTIMHPARYSGIWDVAQKTWRHEGVRGLYKGLMPNLLKVAPALSITWMVYEKAKLAMNLT